MLGSFWNNKIARSAIGVGAITTLVATMMFGGGGFNPATASSVQTQESSIEQPLVQTTEPKTAASELPIGVLEDSSEEVPASPLALLPESEAIEAPHSAPAGGPQGTGKSETADTLSGVEAVEDLPAPRNRAQALAARLKNPQLPETCGLSVAIVLDLSNSLSNSHVVASKDAAKGVVESLRGTPSSIGVYTFATFGPDRTNTATPNTSVSTAAGAETVKKAISNISRVPENVGGTNWDAALRQIPQGQYDIVLFVTDGNPTAYGTPHAKSNSAVPMGNTDFGKNFDPIDLSTAEAAADALKSRGSFVMGLAVGKDINILNIQKISGTRLGTDYFKISDYADLAAQLAEIALNNCQGTVSVVKQVRGLDGKLSPAPGWTFNSRTGDNVVPGSGVTGKDGAVNFKVENLANSTRTVRFSEVQQQGYELETQSGSNAVCVNNTTGKKVAVTNSGDLGFTMEIKRQDAVSCEVVNKLIPPVPVIEKSSDPVSGTEVKPGEIINYRLKFGNEGYSPLAIDHVDHLANVLDDATFNNDIQIIGEGLSAVRGGANNDQMLIKGTVAPGKPVTIKYSVKVKTEKFGDGIAKNFVVPKGENPPTVCEPDSKLCTEHPIPGKLVSVKSADPESGRYLEPGSVVKYALTFKNTGASAVDVSHVDNLSDVLDDATFNTNSLVACSGLSAKLVGNKLQITGKVPAEQTTTVTYTVTIKKMGFGNGTAANFLVPDGEKPPVVCEPDDPECTTHPILGSATWVKTDEAAKALAGSEWELTGPGDTKPVATKDCIAEIIAACTGLDRDPAAGKFTLESLKWGEYSLKETKAPAGYVLDPTVHKFTIGGGQQANLTIDLGKIKNEQQPALSLPLTGGLGSQSFFLGGGAVLLAALAVLGIRRRKGASQ